MRAKGTHQYRDVAQEQTSRFFPKAVPCTPDNVHTAVVTTPYMAPSHTLLRNKRLSGGMRKPSMLKYINAAGPEQKDGKLLQ